MWLEKLILAQTILITSALCVGSIVSAYRREYSPYAALTPRRAVPYVVITVFHVISSYLIGTRSTDLWAASPTYLLALILTPVVTLTVVLMPRGMLLYGLLRFLLVRDPEGFAAAKAEFRGEYLRLRAGFPRYVCALLLAAGIRSATVILAWSFVPLGGVPRLQSNLYIILLAYVGVEIIYVISNSSRALFALSSINWKDG